MQKKVLKVREDFYDSNLHVGKIVPTFGGSYKILDLDYHNEFGTFILCEYIEKQYDQEPHSEWIKKHGVKLNPNNKFEIIGTIHIPDYRNLLAGIGYYVKNHDSNEILGFSYEETWELVFYEGARNAEASSSQLGKIHTKLIDTIDELPSLDSCYWKISAYSSEGVAYAPLTKLATAKLIKGVEHTVDNRVKTQINQHKGVLTEKTISQIKNISQEIKKTNKIVVLSGAGISTNSGIPDYRSSVQSMWRKNPDILDQLNQETFQLEPAAFWDTFYQLIEQSLSPLVPFPTQEALISTIKAIKPNNGHRFFTWLQNELQKDITIITQNVDGLDKKAGSQNIIEMHGNILEASCPQCHMNYPLVQVLEKDHVPLCQCGSVLRPNVVFFGDEVKQYNDAAKAVADADLIIVVGTSMQVYPFNQLIDVKSEHAKLVLLNGEALDNTLEFHHAAFGDISSMCIKLKEMLTER